MKRAFLVVTLFALVTISLTWFWTHGGRGLYGSLFKTIAPPIYDLIGAGDARIGAYRQRYINWIPFVGLVVATPGLVWKRRIAGLCTGLVALVGGHLALNLTERVYKAAQLPIVASLVSDALPFLLWIIVAYPVVSDWFTTAFAGIPGAHDGPTGDNDGGSPRDDANHESENPER